MKHVVWKPVPNGYTYSANTFQGRHIERATVADDWLTVAWRPESGDEYKASIQLPNDLRLCRATEVDEPAPPDVPAQMAELEAENERLRGRITELLVPPAPALAQPDVPQEEAGYLGTVDWKGWKVDLYQDDGDDD